MADGTATPLTGDRILVARDGSGFVLRPLDRYGAEIGAPDRAADLTELAALVVATEQAAAGTRWVWWRTAQLYPLLLDAGVRVARCHDLAAVQSLLDTFDGAPFTPAPAPTAPRAEPAGQISLFDPPTAAPLGPSNATPPSTTPPPQRWSAPELRTGSGPEFGTTPAAGTTPAQSLEPGQTMAPDQTMPPDQAGRARPGRASGPGGASPHGPDDLAARYAEQMGRIARARQDCPGFGLLVAAESAAWLAAVEMGRTGLPWRVDVHDQVLTDLLGARPRHAGRPPKLQALAQEVSRLIAPDETGPGTAVNPDSPVEVLRAFRRQGVTPASTRAWELRQVDHPAVEPLLRYKELARLHVAHGWHWQDRWVREGRLRPEYVPGGVVTGRWATSGGGALQIPKLLRTCVRAAAGWTLITADAGQLEPRILAALSGDRGMIAATADPDLYSALARQALNRPEAREEAKIGLLAAMYGARASTAAMGALQRRFPQALGLLERAARTGEDGGVVRSVLGRTCPPPDPDWLDVPEQIALARSRARGRFTRNFVIQASAADWANTMVAEVRRRLAGLPTSAGRGELVFFQHDEVLVHVPSELTEAGVEAITAGGLEATRLVLRDRGVHIPLVATPIVSYAEKN